MKRLFGVVLMSVCALGGCTAVHYERTVTVQRDGAGNIVSIQEVEQMSQPKKGKKLPTFYLYDKGAVPAK